MPVGVSDKSRKGRSARAKGKSAELELARIISDVYGYPVRRGKVFYGEPDIVGLRGIHAEVKRQERLNLNDAVLQAELDSMKRQDGLPAVFHRKNRTGWLVTMREEDFARIGGGCPMLDMSHKKRVSLHDEAARLSDDFAGILHGGLATMALETWMDCYGEAFKGEWEEDGDDVS